MPYFLVGSYLSINVVFFGAKFGPAKYDFNRYKGFFIENKKPKFARFQRKKNPNFQIFIISSRS
jgi:hypothetical protein